MVSLLNILLNPPLQEYVIPSEIGNAKVTILSKSRTISRLADHNPAFAPKNVQSNEGVSTRRLIANTFLPRTRFPMKIGAA